MLVNSYGTQLKNIRQKMCEKSKSYLENSAFIWQMWVLTPYCKLPQLLKDKIKIMPLDDVAGYFNACCMPSRPSLGSSRC